MKAILLTFLLQVSLLAISQDNREVLFKCMDDSIKVNFVGAKPHKKNSEGLNGKVKFIIEDYYVAELEKKDKIGQKVPGNCYKYWYSKESQLIRRQNYFDSVVSSDEIFLFNNGLLYQVNIKGPSGKQNNIYYSYDNKGFLIRKTHIYEGKIVNKEVYNYDIKGRLKQQFVFGDGYSSISRGDYYYSGSQLDSVVEAGGKTTFTYYRNGLVKQKNICRPGKIFPTLYKYDRYSNVIEISQPILKSISTISYEYDKEQNWVTKYDYFNGKLMSIVKRAIEYY